MEGCIGVGAYITVYGLYTWSPAALPCPRCHFGVVSWPLLTFLGVIGACSLVIFRVDALCSTRGLSVLDGRRQTLHQVTPPPSDVAQGSTQRAEPGAREITHGCRHGLI
jgi:hypothetical protein